MQKEMPKKWKEKLDQLAGKELKLPFFAEAVVQLAAVLFEENADPKLSEEYKKLYPFKVELYGITPKFHHQIKK